MPSMHGQAEHLDGRCRSTGEEGVDFEDGGTALSPTL